MKDLIEKLQHASAEFAEGDGCIGLNLIGEVITRLEAMVGEKKAVGRVRIDSGEVHIYPAERDAEFAGLSDGQVVYAAPVAQQPQAEAVPEARSLLDRHERVWHRMGELWERCQGKGWPDAESSEFTRLRDKFAPAIRKQLIALAAPQQAEGVPSDTERLNWIEREYVQVDTFSMPTGAGDADVGWTFKEWYEGEREPRLIYRHYKDDLRAAIDAAIAAAKKEAGHE